MSSPTFNITPSLVDDPRHNLEAWTENVETHARNMCASHDLMGALTLVVSDVTWDLVPANLRCTALDQIGTCQQLMPETPLRERSTYIAC